MEGKKIMLLPAGADRCMIIVHLLFFLGTTPTPEQYMFVNGQEQNGPSIRLVAHSLANSASMTYEGVARQTVGFF